MDQILDLARELGYSIQQDERFIRTQLAQAAADEDEELQAYYRMMSALRGSSEALRRGGLRVLAAGNGRIAFSRSIGGERVVVCVNHSIGEWVLPAGRVRFAESAAPSPTGEVVLMRGGFCLLEPSDPEAHISIE